MQPKTGFVARRYVSFILYLYSKQLFSISNVRQQSRSRERSRGRRGATSAERDRESSPGKISRGSYKLPALVR